MNPIPQGYKQTEIGVIPEDWEVLMLKELCSFGGGTTPSRNSYEKYYVAGNHHWVKTLDLKNRFIFDTEEKVTDTAISETSLKKYRSGTVLVAMYGGFNQIGRTGLLKVDATVNQALVAVVPSQKLLSDYLLFNLNFYVDYWKSVASSSRKDPNITSNDVKSYLLAVPPKPEQTAIAQILSDMDEEIQALQTRLSKTQQIKQGMMQQLLTGKVRLIKPSKEIIHE